MWTLKTSILDTLPICVVSFLKTTLPLSALFFFFNDTATTEIYTLPLHDALPISMEVSASLPSSSLNGLIIASIFFITDPPGRVASNRRAPGVPATKAREVRRFDDADGCGTPPACLRNGHESGKCPRFGRWGAGLRPALRYAVPGHLGVEPWPPQPERRRRRLRVPLRHLEGTQDRHALDLLERADGYLRGRDCRGRAGLGVSALERLGEVIERDLRPAGHEHRALERILELTDVARPCVGEQPPVRLRLDPLDVAAVLGAVALEERADEERDVLAALAQRGDIDGDGVDPEEQILAQPPLTQGDLGAPVGRRDEAEIHRDGPGGAHPAHRALLEHAEELRLELRRHLRDLVEEERAPVRLLEKAGFVVGGAREAAAGMAEQLRLDEVLRQCGTVDLHPRPAAPPAPLVERVGDELLAGPALADDQHVGVCVSHGRDRLQDTLHPGGLSEDLAADGAVGQAAPEAGVLDGELT